MDLNKLQYNIEPREKKAFYPSDFNKSLMDIYFSFKGEKPTNPPKWYDTLKWGAGKGVEEEMLSILKMNGIVNEDYDQKEHGRIEIQREGVQINGYIDALTKNGEPIEIKSINNKNIFDIKNYRNGYPKENYVGQLSIYIDALGVDCGWLFAATVDGLERFLFKATKQGEYIVCGQQQVSPTEQYKKWAKFYKDCIEGGKEPPIFEYYYKTPLEKIDWKNISKNQIRRARSNDAVIGDWQMTYSPYKDLIVQLQGETLGYTPKELEYIKEKTTGYTTW